MAYNTHRRDGFLVTSPGGGIYVIENGLRRPFPNEATFFSYGYKWTDALTITSAELALIPDGAPLAYNTHFRDGKLISSPGKGIYLVENGLKRPFPSEAIFFSYSYKWADVIIISQTEAALIPDGIAMVAK